ncbi:triose-phosphate isomerase [Marinobacter adhaerens]|jgi:triosephosphate isomerase|uniref:Triosephosphate isomerase n=2 Tax=Marinobacter adhaerens TaxID=1033846 RepID=A0ABX8IKD1_9GAMM|nr:triose-phosphate isomerase [Marinobacter adhaerens]MAM52853.1 triose-phosphate isomerase [Marinobacter sp.]ADP98835.1 triosephosphate isomerase [Marinobacter adhaerens HP15]MBQ91937.1 triose-phosphate isomerase [Marinobacter sp.]MBW3226701.1 triose-phosphate isomerase [Marinobacter adhaerens]MBW4976657.1 triose-phosphate isomerase [Marinobacter adhaerens]|tara:strand:+ start:61 stop:819 length:759 start_codon:yes stop_codon:yes gene_type:complete
MRRKIVAGNWKMNGSKDLAQTLVSDVRSQAASLDNGVEVVIIPPAIYVPDVVASAGDVLSVGVQNVAQWASGAYTGEISADMALDQGCQYALVGHSERRQLFAETDAAVAEKVGRILASGLQAMVCVGETLEEREAGKAETVVAAQVKAGLATVASEQWQRVVVAYEPVWAIGTGKTATAQDAQAMHASIRQVLSEMGAPANEISLLYGGSVKADNAAALFAEPDIDGGLIGGASLKAEDFVSICRSVPAGT